MKDLKIWLQKRKLNKKEAEGIQSPESLEDFFSFFSTETKILLKNYLSKNGQIDLKQVESFIKNPESVNSLYKDEAKFYQNFIKEKYLTQAIDLCKSLYYLSAEDLNKMAIDPKDFKQKISNYIDDNGKNIVSHKNQMQDFPASKSYVNFLNHPKKEKALDFTEGLASKMVHNHQHEYLPEGKTRKLNQKDTYMIKPYHPTNDDADLTQFPLHGWSTITTKALFNAGNIGHLSEDVGVHEHEGTPITVHKFNNNADMMLSKRYDDHLVDPLEIHQIGVMDYLANNLDRHLGNLMLYKDKTGTPHLMGIDHERNFVYNNTYKDQEYDVPETPFGYSKVKGLEETSNGAKEWKSHKPLVDWWNKNGMNIQKEFAKQTSSIKDPAIRKHVYDNFMHRWERMDDWAKFIKSNQAYQAVNAEDLFEPAEIKKFQQPINQKILAALPKNPRDAVSALFDIANRNKKLNINQASQVKEALSSVIKQMDPKTLAGIYKDSLENPNWEIYGSKAIPNLRSLILDHLTKPEEYYKNKPLYKLNHIKAVADTIDSLPEEHNKGLIQKEHAKKLRGLISKVTRKAA